jgi:fructose-1,6-bisphosphatase/inositol monophosphatase family enzyme
MWEGDVWVAVRAARAGATVVRQGFAEDLSTEMKGEVDPVTQVDRDAEEVVKAVIGSHFPDDAILAE